MDINLEQFVGQNVIVTFRDGEVHEGNLEYNEDEAPYSYWLEADEHRFSFLKDGIYVRNLIHDNDIVKIRLAPGILPSGNAAEKVAMALLPDIADALQQDGVFQNLLRQKIERQLDKLMDGGLVDKTFEEVAEVLAQNIVVTTKAQ